MPSYERIGYGSPDGAQFGGAAAELIGFHGAIPSAQGAANTTITVAAAVSVSSVVGFASATTLSALIGTVNAIAAFLKAKGLTA